MLRWWRWLASAVALAGVLLALAVPAPTSFSAMVGTADDARVAAGVLAREGNADSAFRWTNGDAVVRFAGFETAGALAVTIRATPPQRSTPTPLDVTWTADGLAPLHMAATPAWRTYHFWVPRAGGNWSAPVVRVQADPVRASDADDRKVGLALSAVEATGMGVAPWAVAQRTTFLLALLALVGITGARIVGRNLTFALLPCLTLTFAAARWFAPQTVDWWLPQLWTAAGLGAALVVAPPLGRWVSKGVTNARWIMFAAIAAALGGTTLLSLRLALPLGWVLLVGGSFVAAAALPTNEVKGINRRFVVITLLAVVAVALFVRFYQLGTIPFGLWRDEARFGILARRILDDPAYRPIYVPGGVDYPALLFYLTALVIEVVGVRPESVRVVAALAGSLAPLSLYALGRRVVGAPAALLAAALMAVAAWHISLSRISFVAVLDPLFTLAGLALLWSALDARAQRRTTQVWLRWALAGCVLGLALWTYHTARVVPLLAALLCATVGGRSRTRWRDAAGGLVVAAATMMVVAAPLLWYALANDDRFNLRVSQTSVLRVASDLAVGVPAILDLNLRRYLAMWHLYGEPNGRHYAPNRPMLDIVTGAFALVGLWQTLRRLSRTDVFLLAWFAVELVPPLFSEGAPHAVRSVGLIAPAMLLAGRGLSALGMFWSRRAWLVVGPAVALVAALNLRLYFGVMPYDPAIWARFNAPETMIARYVRDNAAAGPFAVPRRIALHDTVQYLAPDVPLQIININRSPTPFASGTQVLVPDEAPIEERRWAEAATGAQGVPMSPYPGTDRPTFWLYRAP